MFPLLAGNVSELLLMLVLLLLLMLLLVLLLVRLLVMLLFLVLLLLVLLLLLMKITMGRERGRGRGRYTWGRLEGGEGQAERSTAIAILRVNGLGWISLLQAHGIERPGDDSKQGARQ